MDSPRSTCDAKDVENLVCFDSNLDYAILKLKEESGRRPLPICGREVSVKSGERVPVNIIQHPYGGIKKLAIRNNLAVKTYEMNIAYFTDTDGGSSGSPVCNDAWEVVALHKASTLRAR